MSVAAVNGQLGNSRLWFKYDEVIQREFENALNKAARLICEIAGLRSSAVCGKT